MKRRNFIQKSSMAAVAALLTPSIVRPENWNTQLLKTNEFMGVLGPLKELGITLVHEHVIADFIGAKETGPHRYDADKVVEKAVPYLLELKKAGCRTFIDCTPAYLGRDVQILKRVAEASGLQIITNTGYYGAVNEKFLPAHAYTETPEQLSARWIAEWENGIEGTGIRPGFIKTSVDEGALRPIYQKLLTACALTHLKTGLTISAHTGNGEAALEEIVVLQKNGVHPSAFRWVHAQNEKDKQLHLKAARMGAWVEFDGINGSEPESIAHHVDCVKHMKENGLLNKILISHDAGWYWVGEPNGGTWRDFTAIFEKFIPALRTEGFTEKEINQLLVENPKESFTIKVRTSGLKR